MKVVRSPLGTARARAALVLVSVLIPWPRRTRRRFSPGRALATASTVGTPGAARPFRCPSAAERVIRKRCYGDQWRAPRERRDRRRRRAVDRADARRGARRIAMSRDDMAVARGFLAGTRRGRVGHADPRRSRFHRSLPGSSGNSRRGRNRTYTGRPGSSTAYKSPKGPHRHPRTGRANSCPGRKERSTSRSRTRPRLSKRPRTLPRRGDSIALGRGR